MRSSNDFKPECHRADSAAPCLRDQRTWHGGKILVVEDSYLLAEMIGDFLQDCGLEPVGPVGWLPQGCQLAGERAARRRVAGCEAP